MQSTSTTRSDRPRMWAVARTLAIFLPIFLLVLATIAIICVSDIRSHRKTLQEDARTSVFLGKQLILDTLAPVIADLRYLSRVAVDSGILNPATKNPEEAKHRLEADFVDFSTAHGKYDQLRVIDAAGRERVRINHIRGAAVVVGPDALQIKRHRYYFSQAVKLDSGEFYVSPMDLNIEHGELENPPKPMIRLATPISGDRSETLGVVVINYTAGILLENLSRANRGKLASLMLLNADGYWLKGERREDEWGFMHAGGEKLTFGNRYPAAWEKIKSVEAGQLTTSQGMFTFSTVSPLEGCPEWAACPPDDLRPRPDAYHWIIVSHLTQAQLTSGHRSLFTKAVGAAIIAFLILGFLSMRLIAADLRRRDSEDRLRQSKATLEQAVVERTSELQASNEALRAQIEERTKMATALRESERQFRTLVETMREGICVIDTENRFTFVNQQFCTMLGYQPEEIEGHEYGDFLDPKNLDKLRTEREKRRRGSSIPYELQWIRKNGAPVLTYVSPSALYNDDGAFYGSFAVVTDITEQKRSEADMAKLEHQLRQAQKMEAIGVLAGGIAHDFNNILMPIMGYTELIKESLPEGNAILGYIHPILNASQRAKELVAQILSFSRQSSDTFQPAIIAPLVKEPLKLLSASLPSSIEIQSRIEATDAMVMANPVQIHQLVMNLCTNAYHAMEQSGGKLIVSLTEGDSASSAGRQRPSEAVKYVCLTVSDTGKGIEPESLSRIFEPYFTTKEQSKGTGLGLSVVHGIVTACKGEINVESRLGEGTTFSVFLPLIARPSAAAPIEPLAELKGGKESILLVDDEEPIVNLEKRVLEGLGYAVTSRLNSLEALEVFQADPYRFDLVITDLTMPHLSGLKLAERILAMRPDIPILMLTGFSEQISDASLKKAGIRQVIMKPALTKDIAEAIRRVLDGNGTHGGISGTDTPDG